MPATRVMSHARLRRARVVVVAALTIVTAGLSAAVAGVIPGRPPARQPARDPFSEPLTAFPPAGLPQATSAPPVSVSGAS